MYRAIITHTTTDTTQPLNNHTWVRDFNTLEDAMQYIRNDYNNVNDKKIIKSYQVVKL